MTATTPVWRLEYREGEVRKVKFLTMSEEDLDKRLDEMFLDYVKVTRAGQRRLRDGE